MKQNARLFHEEDVVYYELMVSYRLRIFFFISALLFTLHGIEEYLTDFHHVDLSFKFVFAPLLIGDASRAAFVTFQVMIWILLWISFIILQGRKWLLRLLFVFGIVMIFELHHLFEAVIKQSYYPGALTALFFPLVAFFYWKELLREFNTLKTQN